MDKGANRAGISFGVAEPGDEDVVAEVLATALHFPVGYARQMVDWVGIGQYRVIRRGSKIVAALVIVPMGQWYNGGLVQMHGIAGVGVTAPERGTGVGAALMRGMLADLHAAHVPLSALYPATLRFYQAVGYERAGQRITYRLPLDAIAVRHESAELVPVTASEYAAINTAYRERAQRVAGNLDRPDWMWQQRLEPKDQAVERWLVANAGRVEGYAVFKQGTRDEPLKVFDLCVLTAAAGRRLLGLFAGYRTMVEHVEWEGGPHDPFVHLFGETFTAGIRPRYTVIRPLEWALRIVDLAAALSTRVYPPGVTTDVELDVQDDLLTANSGRWRLEVADGRATVERGGAGRIRLGIRELAAIYSGYMMPSELQSTGAIEGPAGDLAQLGALFNGPRPWMPDMF